jgi:hypothetical protein
MLRRRVRSALGVLQARAPAGGESQQERYAAEAVPPCAQRPQSAAMLRAGTDHLTVDMSMCHNERQATAVG